MTTETGITIEQFNIAAKQLCAISDRIADGWKFFEDKVDAHKSYVKKCIFTQQEEEGIQKMFKTEYVIYYNLSYAVPSFSFNMWNSSGVLVSLEDIRQMSFIKIEKEDFYSVITQQEHPIFQRPFFIMHPCHTATLLSEFKDTSRNIIVTFLGLITPLLNLKLPVEYGL